jgi:GT2 family glycosyltransferase
MNDVDVSIVIVSWNTRDLLAQCLRSIEDEAGAVTREVFVVDNASADDSVRMVEESFPDVHLIRNDHNVGYARANNQAIRRARGRYVLLLNPDTLVVDGAIEKTVAFLDGEPSAGIATCKVINPDGTFQTCFSDFFPSVWSVVTGGSDLRASISSVLLTRDYLATDGVAKDRIARSHPVCWVMGAAMMIRREVIEQVGLLDEQLFMYGEEPDLCFRAGKAGWKMWYTPAGSIIHLGGQSTKQVAYRKVIEWRMKTDFLFLRKHFGGSHVLAAYLAGLAAGLVKLAMYGTVYLAERDAERLERRRDKLMHSYHAVRWYLTRNVLRLASARSDAAT